MRRGQRTCVWCVTAAALTLAVALTLAGCGGAEHVGPGFTTAVVTPIAEILASPAAHEGHPVKVEGTIATECPTGCWFEIGEGTTLLYVDLEPAGLAIPQRVGRTATVEGTVTLKDGKAQLLGVAVEIR